MLMEMAKNYTDSTNDSNIITSMVELKTPTPGVTRIEQIKTGFNNVNDYFKYLQDKYSYMNAGTVSIHGIPTTLSVSGAFLKKCMNNPEKAKYLEENLAVIPDCVQMAINLCSWATVVRLSYQVDGNGNISCAVYCKENNSDEKIAKENAKRKAKEKKKIAEKAQKRQAEKKRAAKRWEEIKEQTENLADDKETEIFIVSVTGTDVKSVTQSFITNFSGISASIVASFDIKA